MSGRLSSSNPDAFQDWKMKLTRLPAMRRLHKPLANLRQTLKIKSVHLYFLKKMSEAGDSQIDALKLTNPFACIAVECCLSEFSNAWNRSCCFMDNRPFQPTTDR